MAELRGLGAVDRELTRRGGKLLAISVDDAKDSRRAAERFGLRFPLLTDKELGVIHAYGLVHAHGGPAGADIAVPAHFLLDRSRRIVWRRVSSRIQDRADPEEDLRQIEALH